MSNNGYDALKSEADGLFRSKRFVNAIEKYTAAIESSDAKGIEKCHSNRAACREKLVGTSYGKEKSELIEGGLEDGRKCVKIDPAFVRGYQRLATFLILSIKDTTERGSENDDFQEPNRDNDNHDENDEDDNMSSFKGRSASADAAVLRLRRELEGTACRGGLVFDPANEALLEALQTLRDLPSDEFKLDKGKAPTDEDLSAAEGAGMRSAAHKAAGAKAFGRKDWVTAEKSYTKALACDPVSAATVPSPPMAAASVGDETVAEAAPSTAASTGSTVVPIAAGQATAVLYSNRSASKAAQEKYAAALRDADRCLALRPEWSKGQSRRSTALFGLGRYGEAEAACIAGIALDAPQGETAAASATTSPLHGMLAKCQKETCEPLAVQREMYRLRQKAKQDAKLQELMASLSGGGTGAGGGPKVFNMSNLNFSGGNNPFANLGGLPGLGGAGQQPKMSEQQMRQMARAVAGSGGGGVTERPSTQEEDEAIDVTPR
eukprot:CAMPEP_0194138342 /NCGR_PEP_ID=MMETSP0152-20130528/8155_1 /TAXON_ID=1049557 /ORGANISM="Thalassiothrix antarctica, Strain L6-D1" /LENGTH=491 /DNA_ID=CAMNT_0038835771 /DNA_START=180 /DNA_END=1655 /DNA_ORIENTATION=+